MVSELDTGSGFGGAAIGCTQPGSDAATVGVRGWSWASEKTPAVAVVPASRGWLGPGRVARMRRVAISSGGADPSRGPAPAPALSPGAAPTPGVPQAPAAIDVVYVNYDSSAWVLTSVASLLAAPRRGFELASIAVVDNASRPGERALLAGLPADVRVIDAGRNSGFAAGCNLGARAGKAPALLFLNPDTRVLPDTLPALVEAWRAHGGRAMVGPRHFMDDACTLGFAPLHGTSLAGAVVHALWGRGFLPGLSLRWLHQRAALWQQSAPVEVRCLSGAALLVGREVYAELGGFDERFFLYVEDTDLCVRARAKRVPVLYEPRARVVHYGDQSSRQDEARAGAAAARGEHLYLAKHHGPLARAARQLALALVRRLPDRQRRWREAEPVALDHEFQRPGGARWAVELGRSPLFDNGITVFPAADRYRVPADLWPRLRPGTYFARVVAGVARGRWREHGLYALTVRPAAD